MTKQRVLSAAKLKRIRALEITHAYAEYKTRIAGDLDGALDNWADNIMRYIENAKAKK